MAFDKGNKHAAKSKVFDQALRRAIAQDDGVRLRAAAEKLLDKAAEGEVWAIRELADRLDGKSVSTHDVTVTKDVKRLSTTELLALISAERAASEGDGSGEPAQVH